MTCIERAPVPVPPQITDITEVLVGRRIGTEFDSIGTELAARTLAYENLRNGQARLHNTNAQGLWREALGELAGHDSETPPMAMILKKGPGRPLAIDTDPPFADLGSRTFECSDASVVDWSLSEFEGVEEPGISSFRGILGDSVRIISVDHLPQMGIWGPTFVVATTIRNPYAGTAAPDRHLEPVHVNQVRADSAFLPLTPGMVLKPVPQPADLAS